MTMPPPHNSGNDIGLWVSLQAFKAITVDVTTALCLNTESNHILFGLNSIARPRFVIQCSWGHKPHTQPGALTRSSRELRLHIQDQPSSTFPVCVLCWAKPDNDTLRFAGQYALHSWGMQIAVDRMEPPLLFQIVDAAMGYTDLATRSVIASPVFQTALLPQPISAKWLRTKRPDSPATSAQQPSSNKRILPPAQETVRVNIKVNDLPDALLPARIITAGRSIGFHAYALSSTCLGDIALSADWSRYLLRLTDAWPCPRYHYLTRYSLRGPITTPTRFCEPLNQAILARHAGVYAKRGNPEAIAVFGWELTTWTCIDMDNHQGELSISHLLQMVRCLKSLFPQAVLEARYAIADQDFQEQHAVIALWKDRSRLRHRNPLDTRTYIAGIHCWINWGRWQKSSDVLIQVRQLLQQSGFPDTGIDLFPTPTKAVTLPLRRVIQRSSKSLQADPSYEIVDENLLPLVDRYSLSSPPKTVLQYTTEMWSSFSKSWAAAASSTEQRLLPESLLLTCDPIYSGLLWASTENAQKAADQAEPIEDQRVPAWKATLQDHARIIPVVMPAPLQVTDMPSKAKRMTKGRDLVAAQFVMPQSVSTPSARHIPPSTVAPKSQEFISAQTIAERQGGFTAGQRNEQSLQLVQFCMAHGYDLQFAKAIFQARWSISGTKTPLKDALHIFTRMFKDWSKKYKPKQQATVEVSDIESKIEGILTDAGELTPKRNKARTQIRDILVQVITAAIKDPRTWSCRLLPDSYLMKTGKVTGSCRRVPNKVKNILRHINCVPLSADDAQSRLQDIESKQYVGRALYWDIQPLMRSILP